MQQPSQTRLQRQTLRVWRSLSFLLVSLAVATFILLSAAEFPFLLPETVQAQVLINPQKAADQFYQRLPDFPKENQYISVKTRKQALDNTLVERLIQYHTVVKARSPAFRLDWKITLADYLGINDFLVTNLYPGRTYLKTNPLEGDRAVIQKLNRQQRELLVQTLVDIYAPGLNQATQAAPAPPAPAPNPAPASVPKPTLQPLPRPGDAQLLAPPASSGEPRPAPTGDARLLAP